MLYKKDIIPNSNYSEDTILAKEGFFKPFIIEALGEVKDISLEYKNVKEKNNSDNRDLKNLRKDLDKILESSDGLLMKSYYFLKTDHKDKTSFYFKKSPSHAAGSLKKTVIEIEVLLKKIKNETNVELNDFELPLNKELAKLKQINKDIHNVSTDIKFNENQENELLKKWKPKYATLKDYVKGFLRGKGLDYKIFFLDLKNKKFSSSSSKDKKDSENIENIENKNNEKNNEDNNENINNENKVE